MEDLPSLLTLLRGCGSAGAVRALLERFGGPREALRSGPRAWREACVSASGAAALQAPERVRLDAEMAWLAGSDRHLIGWHSPDYPPLLRRIGNPPAALFIAGDPTLLWHPQLAVVGTRKPSAGGRDNAHRFARDFGASGLAVTSGLAAGIDTAAHLGALETSRTVAVVATGLDRVFPASNAALMERIGEHGAVVSEYPPGTPPLRGHFPSRNRVIAGLALGVLVVEAAERSGALITARLASEAGREVFALPGSIHNPMARGCHRLLRQGAGLIETPQEAIEALAPVAAALGGALRERLGWALDPAPPGTANAAGRLEDSLWRALGHDPVNLDQLVERTGLTVATLSAMLLAMEMAGQVSAEHGRYSRRFQGTPGATA